MLKKFIIFALVVIMLYAVPAPWTASLRDTSLRAIKPVASYFVRKNTDLTNFVRSIRQVPSLREDKARLEKEVVSLQQSLLEKESVERENETLRKEAGVTGITKEEEKVLAHVLLRGPDLLDRTFVIDVGSANGVKEGQAAVVEGALVGKVISVREHSAVVRSILSRESRVQAWISENQELGLLEADGNQLTLSNITQGIEVKENSIIETSGLGQGLGITGTLPKGILIGTIAETKSKKSDVSQSFVVRPSLDLLKIESLFILLTESE